MKYALLLLVCACDEGKKAPPPPSSPTPTPAPMPVAAPPVDAAPAPAPDDALCLGLPCAPAPTAIAAPDANTVQLTWVNAPATIPSKRDPEILLSPLDLEITVGGKTTNVKLAPQFGALYAYNQVVCDTTAYPLDKHDVGKITFYEGGAGGYVVRRKGNDLVVLSWDQGDGLCGSVDKPVECPKNEKQVFKMAIPATAKFAQAIVDVDEHGARHPFDCGH